MRKLKNIRLNFQYLCFLFNRLVKYQRITVAPTGVIFSKDRPMQLEALLRSYRENSLFPGELIVLYRAELGQCADAYRCISREYPTVEFLNENCFRDDLLKVLKGRCGRPLYFLVDDNIFFRKFDIRQLSNSNCLWISSSLRLGENITMDGVAQVAIDPPIMRFRQNQQILYWLPWFGRGYWSYAFSVDGHLYSADELYFMASLIEFKGPNSFEAEMNRFRWVLKFKIGKSYRQSVLVNFPLNRVQNEIANRSGGATAEALLRDFEEGKRIDVSHLYSRNYNSAHVEGAEDIKYITKV